MGGVWSSLTSCRCNWNCERYYEEQKYLLTDEKHPKNQTDHVKNGPAAKTPDGDGKLNNTTEKSMGPTGWIKNLAATTLTGHTNAVEKGIAMAKGAAKALERGAKVAFQWAKENPKTVISIVVALGIVIAIPSVIKGLGFSAAGPVANTFATSWQACYGGSVPAGSLFSFFQHLGMVWML